MTAARTVSGHADTVPVAEEPDFSLALEEARRTFDALSDELPALRNRATQLLGVSGLAATFLGGLSRMPAGQPIGLWGWVAVVAFVVTAAMCLRLLWPGWFHRGPTPSELVKWAETPGASLPEMQRAMALHMQKKYGENRKKLDGLSRWYSATVVALFVEISAFVINLWS